jgi:hypothetical protein
MRNGSAEMTRGAWTSGRIIAQSQALLL